MFAVVLLVLLLFILLYYLSALLFRMIDHDTTKYDMTYLWSNYPVTLQQMRLGQQNKRK
ncbi:hypothetical protein [Brevibacillus fulvus]|uniref:Uncharacterized protein n=1 Tax=Brevibacillus fulvus TaxID=1125967 RepID=A0A939BV02_9BACL|nr:hypothetical protein [Brevibacillus fulvus]MBM7590146.1 hypothetical protein [Brevibacillus fulvus]